MEGCCFFDATVEALYKEMNRQLEAAKKKQEDEEGGDGDVYDYYVCQGEVPKHEAEEGYISLSELDRSQNMELFDGTEYVDERVFEDSEELSDDEDSNAEGYYDHLLDSWSDDNGRDWLDYRSSDYGDSDYYNYGIKKSDSWSEDSWDRYNNDGYNSDE